MQRRTTIWFLLLFHPLIVFSKNQTQPYKCKIGSVNPLASTSRNACFKLYDTPKSYQAARRHCVSLGGILADKINKDDSSLYSANADLAVGNATQFWVGASNLKCNVAWENGGEIEFNELWAPDSRYYGVAIDKMSLGGLWHTVPVGHLLPFVCTFQGKPKEVTAATPVHEMRAPPKKRPVKEGKPTEDDIDESLNAALADKKQKKEEDAAKKEEKKADADEVDESKNAALADGKKQAEAAAEAKNSDKRDESANAENAAASASVADQKALNANAAMAAATSSAKNDESSDENLDASDIAMRKEVGLAVANMKSQEMAAASKNSDQMTDEDLLAAAATLMGGYSLNLNWADRSTREDSDLEMDEQMLSLALTIAEQLAMAMAKKQQRQSADSDAMSDKASLALAASDAQNLNDASKSASEKASQDVSENASKDQSADSAAMSAEQKAEAAQAAKAEAKDEKADEKAEEKADDEASADEKMVGASRNEVPKRTPPAEIPTTTAPEDDINDSLNAALADQKSTTTNQVELTTVLTTTTAGGLMIGAVKVDRKRSVGCPAEWTQFNANATSAPLCFRRFDKPMNFEDARLFCLAKGGHLASIHNERQLLLLSALLHNNGPDTISNQTWIGLNRIHQKYYVYEDETAMDFTRWLPGAPNINDCTVFTGNELPNYPHKGTQYKFGDYPCEEVQKSVLCEVTLGNDKEHTEPTCEKGWSYYSHDGTTKHGKCYKRIDQSKKFSGAREVCRGEQSYVASVQNDGEARFVSALLQTEQNFTVNEQTWIGYVKYDEHFGWEDGNKGIEFEPWTEKLPRDKKCTVFTGNEIHDDCRSKFRFVSVDCDKSQRAVLCSKSPMKDGVPVVYKATDNTEKPV